MRRASLTMVAVVIGATACNALIGIDEDYVVGEPDGGASSVM